MSFNAEYSSYKSQIDTALRGFLGQAGKYPEALRMSMEYSLFPGGKRLRPVLYMAVFDGIFGKDQQEGLALACALEMIHTYSLIHDDLPAMDNDDYRRGNLTNHRVFGDATAILTGDALLNLSYEIMLENALLYPDNLPAHVRAMKLISNASGANGMVGGQMADIELQWKTSAEDTLDFICRNKTAALIEVSLTAAAALANANDNELKALSSFGNSIGLAFQIIDDVLDFNSEAVEPECGQKCGKLTYPVVYGLNGSKEKAKSLIDNALAELEIFGHKAKFLREIAHFLAGRSE
jgi:geranylgeranyl diphosphate synthase type II